MFNSFRFRIGKSASNKCWFHGSVVDTVEHTVIECGRWEEERRRCCRELGIKTGNPDIKELWELANKDKDSWRIFGNFCKEVLTKKAGEERKREKEGLDPGMMRSNEDDLDSMDPERMKDW